MKGKAGPVRRPRGGDGFTLLETVVSLSILAAIAAFLVVAFRLAGISTERGGSEALESARMRAGIDMLERAIRSSDPMPIVSDSEPVPFFRGEPKGMTFLSASAPSAVSRGGFRLLRLSASDAGSGAPGLLLADASPFRAEGADMWERTDSRRILIRGATELTFRYSPGPTADGKWEWEEEWDAREKKTLPAAVRVGFTVPSAAGPARTEFVVPLQAGGA